MAEKITSRQDNYSQWYLDIILEAKLADYSSVKGCMVIRPNGYAIWERIQEHLNQRFKQEGVQNAYFPMLIPLSFLQKEAEHVEGFSPELLVATHAGGKELEEPLVLRPTSETVIWSMYKKWIHSWRDLPLLLNQWANVIRWEKHTRLFLRSSEFLWQEGHTAHATAEEANLFAQRMIGVYKEFIEGCMAIPVITGVKSESEKFPGAVHTYSIEALMQDNKALQAGTSHDLGQNFGKAFDVQFQDKEGQLQDVYASSWGVSTRLIGALIMTHSDDKGLVLPPKMAATQVVLIPIFKAINKDVILDKTYGLAKELQASGVSCLVDASDANSPGWKFAEWEMVGIPVRLELGAKDLAAEQVVLVRRDSGVKSAVLWSNLCSTTLTLLDDIQKDMLSAALIRQNANTKEITTYAAMTTHFTEEQGGYAVSDWCGELTCEKKMKEEFKATIRNIPFHLNGSDIDYQNCAVCGQKAQHRVIWARNY